MAKFIKLTVIESNGHEIMKQTETFINADHIAFYYQQQKQTGYHPKRTVIAMANYGAQHTMFVAETASHLSCYLERD